MVPLCTAVKVPPASTSPCSAASAVTDALAPPRTSLQPVAAFQRARRLALMPPAVVKPPPTYTFPPSDFSAVTAALVPPTPSVE